MLIKKEDKGALSEVPFVELKFAQDRLAPSILFTPTPYTV
jgi:hypothetical protein